MGFAEGSIKEEKVFGDAVFPKTLIPSSASDSGIDVIADTIKRERASLAMTLQQHGAILFRGFEVRSADEFDRVVRAFGWEPMPYVGAVERISVTDRVCTANEAPVDVFINFHHEMAFAKQSPSKIFFFCEVPAPAGGETSIVLSNVIVEKMEERHPEVVSKLSDVGFTFCLNTDKDAEKRKIIMIKEKAKKNDINEGEGPRRRRMKLNFSQVNYNTDGSEEFVFGPTNPIREFGGKKAWFLPFLGYNLSEATRSFGDGSTIPADAFSTYEEILEKNCVDVKWQKGDILLVDNNATQHARRPGKPPRRMLVSLCK